MEFLPIPAFLLTLKTRTPNSIVSIKRKVVARLPELLQGWTKPRAWRSDGMAGGRPKRSWTAENKPSRDCTSVRFGIGEPYLVFHIGNDELLWISQLRSNTPASQNFFRTTLASKVVESEKERR